jgi:hypothetical protein
MAHDQAELSNYIREKFASFIQLPTSEFIAQDLTLAAIISRSDKLTNSLDLMEAFAKTANGLKKDYGFRVRLPSFGLDTPISTVLAAFSAEITKA